MISHTPNPSQEGKYTLFSNDKSNITPQLLMLNTITFYLQNTFPIPLYL